MDDYFNSLLLGIDDASGRVTAVLNLAPVRGVAQDAVGEGVWGLDKEIYAPTHVLSELSQCADLQPLAPHMSDVSSALPSLVATLAAAAAAPPSIPMPLAPSLAHQLIEMLARSDDASPAGEERLSAVRQHIVLRLVQGHLGRDPHLAPRAGQPFFASYLTMLSYVHQAWRSHLVRHYRAEYGIDFADHMIQIIKIDDRRIANAPSWVPLLVPHPPHLAGLGQLEVMEAAYWARRLGACRAQKARA